MIISYNLFGEDMIDMTEKTEADRIGERIRRIREEKEPKMTQAEFGKLLGLNANRIQQYENGARKPKPELIKAMAAVLGVEAMSLVDPVISSLYGVMYGFFELEDIFNLRLKEIDGQIHFCFGDNPIYYEDRPLNEYMEIWYKKQKERDALMEKAESEHERNQILAEYHQWRNTFPQSIVTVSNESKIESLKEEIRIKQEELARLEKEIEKK